MKVIATIQSTLPGEHPEVETPYYKGEDPLDALHAVTTLMRDRDFQYTRILAIRVEF